MVSLCACGRRGELEPPPSPYAVQTPANNHNLDLHRTSRTITPPDKDFVLDPLLK
jgi:predicted small lipoprotein YifL